MADLTLADVERTEAAMLAANAAEDECARLRPQRVAKWHEHQQAVINADDACSYLAEVMRNHGPALLALAREALERRRDVAALDDDPDPEDTARQERLDGLLYHPPVPKDPY